MHFSKNVSDKNYYQISFPHQRLVKSNKVGTSGNINC